MVVCGVFSQVSRVISFLFLARLAVKLGVVSSAEHHTPHLS